MGTDGSKDGRPRRGLMVVVACADGDLGAGQAELLRCLTAMADYVVQADDAAAGDEALDFLVKSLTGAGSRPYEEFSTT